MADASFHQSLSQQQTLAPQMRQSLEILQANTQELQQLLRQAMDINPALEDDITSLSIEELEHDAPSDELPTDTDFDDLRELAIMENRSLSYSQDDLCLLYTSDAADE